MVCAFVGDGERGEELGVNVIEKGNTWKLKGL